MDLFDDVQLAQEKLGIDMEALLEAMGISACEGDHTEQENILLHAFLTGFSTLPLIHVENDDIVREQVCSYLGYLGIEFNTELNKGLRGKETELSMPGSKVKVFVIPTNEELAIARETLELVRK